MRLDIAALQRFYASPLGAHAQAVATERLAALWPSAKGLDVLGLGYPVPFLGRYQGEARRVAVAMPAAQGAHAWPETGRCAAVLVDESRLPFPDALFDRVILAHVLEEGESERRLLREIWRITAPEGRIVAIAANRTGLWSLADSTPLGRGRPFSRGQLFASLQAAMFEPTASARLLHAPPWGYNLIGPIAPGLEKLGGALWPALGGILMMEAVKRLTASPGPTAPARAAPVRAAAVEQGLQRARGWALLQVRRSAHRP